LGSPLSPILADIVIQDLEEKAIHNFYLQLPLFPLCIPFLCTFGSPYAFDNILSLAFKEINIRIRQLIRRKTIKKSEHKKEVENRRMIVFSYIKGILETIDSSLFYFF